MSAAGFFGTIIGWFVAVFAIALAILWTILPFAIFGIKDRLDGIRQSLDALRGSVDLLRREASGMRENQSAEIDAMGRIERIQSAAHHVKFED